MSLRVFLLSPNTSTLTSCLGDLPTLKVGYQGPYAVVSLSVLLSDLLVFA